MNDPVNLVDPDGLINRRGGHGYNRNGHYTGPFGGICGAEGSYMATWIPDISPDACTAHDLCYLDCNKTQWQCDYELFKSNVPYGLAVMFGGQSAYQNAQKGCECN